MLYLYVGTTYITLVGNNYVIDDIRRSLTVPDDEKKITFSTLVDNQNRVLSGLLYMLLNVCSVMEIEIKLVHDNNIYSPKKSPLFDKNLSAGSIPVQNIIIDPNMLNGITLYEDQVQSITKAIHRVRSHAQIPTGGGKTEVAIAFVKWLIDNGYSKNALFLTGATHIMDQTIERSCLRGLNAGHMSDESAIVKVGMIQTSQSLIKRGIDPWNGVHFDTTVYDEVHHLPCDQWSMVGDEINSTYRLGLSATPYQSDSNEPVVLQDYKMIGYTGKVSSRITLPFLINKGRVAKPVAVFLDVPGESFWSENWNEVNKRGVVENHKFHSKLSCVSKQFCDLGYKVLILVREKKHGAFILEALQREQNYSSMMFAGGKKLIYADGSEDRGDLSDISDAFNSDGGTIGIGTPALGEGVDIQNINVIIPAYSGKSYRNALQGVGRAMRAKKGGSNVCFLVDWWHTSHPFLISHSKKRRRLYIDKGFEVGEGVDHLNAYLEEPINLGGC